MEVIACWFSSASSLGVASVHRPLLARALQVNVQVVAHHAEEQPAGGAVGEALGAHAVGCDRCHPRSSTNPPEGFAAVQPYLEDLGLDQDLPGLHVHLLEQRLDAVLKAGWVFDHDQVAFEERGDLAVAGNVFGEDVGNRLGVGILDLEGASFEVLPDSPSSPASFASTTRKVSPRRSAT